MRRMRFPSSYCVVVAISPNAEIPFIKFLWQSTTVSNIAPLRFGVAAERCRAFACSYSRLVARFPLSSNRVHVADRRLFDVH